MLLTTANHPDVLMDLVESNTVYCVVIMSFMIVGNIVFMNLVLAVITDSFKTDLEDSSQQPDLTRILTLYWMEAISQHNPNPHPNLNWRTSASNRARCEMP